MKTTLQKAIEAVKDYRDMGTADVDTCNAILLQLASLLPEEKEQTIQFMYDCNHDLLHSVGDGWELAKDPYIYYNEIFER